MDFLHARQGANLLQGGSGDDALYAGKGGDTLDGGDGIDTIGFVESHAKNLVVDLEDQTATTAHGSFTLISIENVVSGVSASDITGDDNDNAIDGSAFWDTLRGGIGDDSIAGGGGKDLITGGAGADLFVGGRASDTFIFDALSDSSVGAPDHINDLEKKDVIDLSAIDADTNIAGDQAFSLVSSFDGHAGELWVHFDSDSGNTFVDGDVDGDGQADLRIVADGHLFFDIKHFVL
jgi:Ca2+-binding RTX toxin-like protein